MARQPTSDRGEKKDTASADFYPPWMEIVKLVPSILWFCLAAIVIFKSYDPLMNLVKQGAIQKIGVGAVQIEFAKVEVHLQRVRGLDNQGIPESDQKQLLERFNQLAEQLAVTSILWVDDQNPQQNASLRPLLTSLGVNIDLATSTADANKWLNQAHYDIVITDLDRPGDPTAPCYSSSEPANAGCALLKAIGGSRKGEWPRLIVYAENFDPEKGMPPFAEGVATLPGPLLHLILNAVARINLKS
jgi:CheY-like chemotaxis protein